jgi:1,4-dihydroxy-6-naphthoate synthase
MTQLIRIGHSPDADDAFMFYAMTHGKVTMPGVRIEHVLEDIESLNRRAGSTELEVTAVSCATYPSIADRYRLMDPGASMGKGYGPIVVAREPMSPEGLADRVIAIPGYGTTAYLLLRLALGDPAVIVVAFDQIPGWWRRGRPTPASSSTKGRSPTARWGSTRCWTWASSGRSAPGSRCRWAST